MKTHAAKKEMKLKKKKKKRKFNPRLLFIIPFTPETPWMLSFSWGNEQPVESPTYDQKFTEKEIVFYGRFLYIVKAARAISNFLKLMEQWAVIGLY